MEQSAQSTDLRGGRGRERIGCGGGVFSNCHASVSVRMCTHSAVTNVSCDAVSAPQNVMRSFVWQQALAKLY